MVDLLRWPAQAGRRRGVDGVDQPCVWLLGIGELPPELGPLEDWVRVPVDERDLHARVQRLAGRAAGHSGLVPGAVHVDDDGVLRHGDRLVVIPDIEAAILDRLGRTPEQVVSRAELSHHTWPDEHRSPRAIDSRVHTLRSRIAPVGLAIHTIRGRGFLLATDTSAPTNASASQRTSPWRTSWSSSSPPS